MMTSIGIIVFGAYFVLIGLEKVKVSKNPEKNAEWVKKYGAFFKIGGPIMIVIGIALLFLK